MMPTERVKGQEHRQYLTVQQLKHAESSNAQSCATQKVRHYDTGRQKAAVGCEIHVCGTHPAKRFATAAAGYSGTLLR